MANPRKYMFDRDFGAPQGGVMVEEMPVEYEPEPEPEPTYSQADLANAHEQGRAEGREQAIREAQASLEQAVARAMAGAAAGLHEGVELWRAALESRHRDAVAVAVAVMRKIQPEISRRNAFDEIVAIVSECVAQLDGEARVVLRVHPALLGPVQERANAAAAEVGFEGKLVVSPDPRLAVGDCRVEWNDGGGERDQARLWAEIDDALVRGLGEDKAKLSFAPNA